ncbi:Uncharacterised protein [Mycobacteroides abscessus subsp. abscessus]|nr:Uncharacterised protein [Mycobacteroides abscessus subsp. abscessus]
MVKLFQIAGELFFLGRIPLRYKQDHRRAFPEFFFNFRKIAPRPGCFRQLSNSISEIGLALRKKGRDNQDGDKQ